ncbi:MAG: radical SAM protein [Kiritimatiellae bacterium]|nr:radical SAM protein [Kiritimatiellia bacterium]
MKVLLLNPPGKDVYIRDYYCSKVSQANYISQPVDLLVISGALRAADYNVFLVDAIVDSLSPERTLEKIRDIGPDVIISLAGAVSWEEDKEFFKKLKSSMDIRLAVCGDLFLDDAVGWLERNKFLDAIILDFTATDIVGYINDVCVSTETFVCRGPDGAVISMTKGSSAGVIDMQAAPFHKLFLRSGYRYPFTLSPKYCSVLTQYGCPFDCSFCIMGKLRYRTRSAKNTIDELRYIISLGVREVFFVDQTFGADRKGANELLMEMVKQKLNLSWFCFSRVDVLTSELLELMKNAGCHTVILGIESGSDALLAKYRKGYDKARIRQTLQMCREHGIHTVGTFILGLPDETEETAKETLTFLKSLPLDYASFNVAVPRAGTDLRDEAISSGLVTEETVSMDQSGTDIAMPTKHLSCERVKQLRRRAVMAFYLRPGYLVGRLLRLRTGYEFVQNCKHAVALFRKTFWGKG